MQQCVLAEAWGSLLFYETIEGSSSQTLFDKSSSATYMGMGIRRGRKAAGENLNVDEEGDCPRCRGEAEPSSLAGFLICVKCSYEWKDPNYVQAARGPPPNHRRDSELIDEFKQEMESGQLRGVLGINKNLSREQEASLQRLEDKWMSGLQGTFNVATEERKPLMISFDDDDNIGNTVIASVTLLNNEFDGGEEVRLEYPGMGTEFYGYDEDDSRGWRRGRTIEDTARNMASIINRLSNFVYASNDGPSILFEMKNTQLDPASLVIYVDDPGGQDLVAEKGGVSMDARDVRMIEDYQAAVQIVLEDGIISPSEDQMLWAMREQLGISDADHVRIVMGIFGDRAVKECTSCGGMADLYPEYAAWYCSACESWV